MPSVSDVHHKTLESEIIQRFEDMGWHSADHTYHKITECPECECKIEPEYKDEISRNFSLTSLLVRSRSDRISFNDSAMVKWDAKTTSWPTDREVPIESFPFLSALSDGDLGAECVFFVRRYDSTDYAFSPRDLLPFISKTLVPDWKWSVDSIQYWKDWIDGQLLRVGIEKDDLPPVQRTDTRNGSGDPFFTIGIDHAETHSIDDYFAELRTNG